MLDYYVGLAEDRTRPDSPARGAVDYYLDPDEPAGRWWGNGVAALGVGREVVAGDLRAVLEGRQPISDGYLGRRFGERSARGFDCTFSAPKSVSVLWAITPDPWVRAEVLAAHEAAVEGALVWFETHGAVTRRGKDGVDQVDTRGVAAAVFRQHTSRALDPQLHSHAIISAKVQDTTGRWLALDARFLKQQQRTIGWVYDAALRTELTARLGVEWRVHTDSQVMDVADVDDATCRLFSERSEQIATKHHELIVRWTAEHDGDEPDPRTIAKLERAAVLATRPGKDERVEAATLHGAWTAMAIESGIDPLGLTAERLARHRTALPARDDALVDAALTQAQAESACWLRADIVRHLTTLVGPTRADSASALVDDLDRLADLAVERCVELGPRLSGPTRRDGRPISEAATDRLLTTRQVLDQEQRLQRWAAASARPAGPFRRNPQLDAIDAIAGHDRLVLIVGPAGTGKTTTTARAVEVLRQERRPVIGLAPSGKAADVLSAQTRLPTTTVAAFLTNPQNGLAPGTTVIIDEAGIVATDDLARVVDVVRRSRGRLVVVGDPAQLPAVGRGGVFAHWCDTVPRVELDTPKRFDDRWEADASLQIRAGNPAAAEIYARHDRLASIHPALLADHIARLHDHHASNGRSVAITTASRDTARQINQAIQRRSPPSPRVDLADGTKAGTGDRIATRRNDRHLLTQLGHQVRNRHVWTVAGVHPDGSLTAVHPELGQVDLPPSYVAAYVELGWAVTGYGNQGDTVDAGIAIIEPGTNRAHAYVGLTRGRHTNQAVIPDATGHVDPADALATAIARSPNRESALAARAELHERAGIAVPLDGSLLDLRHRLRPPPELGRT